MGLFSRHFSEEQCKQANVTQINDRPVYSQLLIYSDNMKRVSEHVYVCAIVAEGHSIKLSG